MTASPKIGILFAVCDGPNGDEKHFTRFMAELTRLGLPYAVHFDHCDSITKKFFKRSPLYIGGYEEDNPKVLFGEDSRQNALDVLLSHSFDWALSLDVDETLEKNAPAKILEATQLGADVVDFVVLDLWLDKRHYRVDGSFAGSHREKMFNLVSDPRLKYTHPTVHAPKVAPKGREAVVHHKFPCRVLHWGIMNIDDVRFHTERWNRVYRAKVGKNPYGFYDYINDPATVPVLKEVPDDIF